MIGLSINYLSQAIPGFALAGLIKRHFSGTRTAMGGGLISAWASIPGFKNPFSGIIDNLIAGRGEPFFASVFNIPEALWTAYEYDYSWVNHDLYLSPGFIMPFSSSNGCYYNRCSFCQDRASAREGFSMDKKTAVNAIYQTKPAVFFKSKNFYFFSGPKSFSIAEAISLGSTLVRNLW